MADYGSSDSGASLGDILGAALDRAREDTGDGDVASEEAAAPEAEDVPDEETAAEEAAAESEEAVEGEEESGEEDQEKS